MTRNPFQQLYVGERISSAEFIQIFSTKLVPHAMPLFQPGHVVLSGVQGSGKSMLFKLLQSDVRVEYAKADVEFPIPAESARFISASINVNTARCNEFGNRKTEKDENIQELMFGDFFNYIVIQDVLKSISVLSSNYKVSSEINLNFSDKKKIDLVNRLKKDDVWEGYFNDAKTFEDLENIIRRRISLYRRYMNANDRSLDPSVAMTKTSAGEPMKVVANALKECGLVAKDVELFIFVDQYEELATIKSPGSRNSDYRSVVNKVMSRDPSVSYRVGTRGYAWRNHLNVFGSDGHLEEDRDYKLIDLDAKLRRHENARTSIFPALANDVFVRRLGYMDKNEHGEINKISDALGKSPLPSDQAKTLAGGNTAALLRLDPTWPIEVRSTLIALAERDPLNAKFGEVWIRQKGWDDPDFFRDPPWMRKSKQYWRKERTELALLQIAGARKQRAIFSGEEDILGLSGGNILIFLSICQYIWDFATQASKRDDREPEIPIKETIQTVGVIQAAKAWLDRIPSDYGRSDDRYKIIQKFGEKFSTRLHSDQKMSNPGQNGISLSIEELRSSPEIFNFLIEAVDYGNLVMDEHTTRNKDKKRRLKFYLNPLYCPIYRIPYQRSKEPLYITAKELEGWLAEAGIIERLEPSPPRRTEKPIAPAPLFDMLETRRD